MNSIPPLLRPSRSTVARSEAPVCSSMREATGCGRQRLGGLADEVSVTALFHLLKCIDTNEITADRSGLQTLLLILQPPSVVSRMWVGWVDMRQGGQSRASRAVATAGTWADRLTDSAAVCKECPAHCTDFDRVIALAERSRVL